MWCAHTFKDRDSQKLGNIDRHTHTHPPPLLRDRQPSALWSSNSTMTRSEESTTEALLLLKVHLLPLAAKHALQAHFTSHVHCIRGSYCLNKHWLNCCRTDDIIPCGLFKQHIPRVFTAMTLKKILRLNTQRFWLHDTGLVTHRQKQVAVLCVRLFTLLMQSEIREV